MIYIASDHQGYKSKTEIAKFLDSLSREYTDLGPHKFDPNDDYPDYAFLLGETVVKTNSIGIIICGSGIGVCIATNKVIGVRAGYCESTEHALKSKQDDNTNILVLDSMTFNPKVDFQIIKTWLDTPFSGEERHIRRINKIISYENSIK